MSCQRSSNREVKPAKTFSWHTDFCICLWRLNTSLGSRAFTIFQRKIAKSPEIHTQRVAANCSSAQPPWELFLCAGLQHWLHVRVIAVSIESYCSSSTLLFVIYLSIIVITFFNRDDQKMELSLKNGGFKVDALWHSGCVCLDVTRCYLVSLKHKNCKC